MVLGEERHNGCKKAEHYADDSSCAHRQPNCRMNDCRASGGIGFQPIESAAMPMPRHCGYSLTVRNRSALAITETELKLIAAPAIIGPRRMPNSGYRTPAAIGTPSAL